MSFLLLLLVFSQSIAEPVLPYTSLAVKDNIYFITDAQNKLWFNSSSEWKQIPLDASTNATVVAVTSPITSKTSYELAIIGSGTDLYTLPLSWASRPNPKWNIIKGNLDVGYYYTKVAGSSSPDAGVWLSSSGKNAYQFYGNFTSSGQPIFGQPVRAHDSVLDIAIRDQIYIIHESSRNNGICVMALDYSILFDCSWPTTFNPTKIAVTDTILYALADDGAIYAAKLPIDKFIPINYKSQKAKFFVTPIDANYPILIKADGTIDSGFCNLPTVECYGPKILRNPNKCSILNKWIPDVDPVECCTNPGISCDFAGNIKSLNFENRGLEGEIPASLGYFDDLMSLNLARNKLTGKVPNSLTLLSNLLYLNISFNQLRGELPTNLNKLGSLKVFNMKSNYLSGDLNLSIINDRLLRRTIEFSQNCFDIYYLAKIGWGADLTQRPEQECATSPTQSTAFLIAILVGSFGGIAAFLGIGLCIFRRKRRQAEQIKLANPQQPVALDGKGDSEAISKKLSLESFFYVKDRNVDPRS
ncbi:hypothetical protein HDU97_005660 [Phlyctochytrium planicorne]|nr:hypothetical protein HDU97_005660 [Phlyctochytrium planicorne]